MGFGLLSNNSKLDFHIILINDVIFPFFPAYIKRKRKMCEKWESIRHDMLKVLIADEFPATFNCVRCNEYSHEIFRCKYCGPTAYFCKGCCTDHHRITLLHQPEMWDTEVNMRSFWMNILHLSCLTVV